MFGRCKHDWERWEHYKVSVSYVSYGTSIEVRQRRICKKCGKMQDIQVR